MSKVREFQTERSERIKIQAELISQKYGPCFKVKDAGPASGFSKSTIWRAIKRGDIKISRSQHGGKRGATVVITALDLARWIENMREE